MSYDRAGARKTVALQVNIVDKKENYTPAIGGRTLQLRRRDPVTAEMKSRRSAARSEKEVFASDRSR